MRSAHTRSGAVVRRTLSCEAAGRSGANIVGNVLGWTRLQNQVSYASRPPRESPITVVDSSRTVEVPAETPIPQNALARAAAGVATVGIPLLLWFIPLGVEPSIQAALAVTSFMILAWMTN